MSHCSAQSDEKLKKNEGWFVAVNYWIIKFCDVQYHVSEQNKEVKIINEAICS